MVTESGRDAAPVAEAPRATGTFRAFHNPNYRLYWAGTMFSSSGQWMEIIITNWLIFELAGSPLLLGLLNFLRAIPMLGFGIIGGTLADRLDRKAILVWTQIALLGMYGTIAVLAFSRLLEPWHLLLTAVGSGIAWAFNQPARQSVVSDIIPRQDLTNAIALSSAAFQTSRVIGPAVAGLLMALFGSGGALISLSVNYLFVILWASMMQVPPIRRPPDAPPTTVVGETAEGLRYVRNTPPVLGLLLIGMLATAFGQPYQVLVPIFAQEIYRIGESGFGILMSAPGIGAMVVALSLARFSHVQRRGLIVCGGAIGFGLSLLVLAFVTSPVIAFVVLMFTGLFGIATMTTSNTVIQTIVPRGMRGRVMGVWTLNRGLMPFGALLAGVLADFLGASPAMAVMGGLTFGSAALLAWRMRAAREVA